MDEIKITDTIGEINKRPEFADMQVMLLHNRSFSREDTESKTIRQIQEGSTTWDSGSMADGFNRLLQIRRSGEKCFYKFYTDEEISKDKSKKQTGLCFFPGEKNNKPFALVVPGGGYMSVVTHAEGFPIAAELNKLGYNAFVLKYRTRVGKSFCLAYEDLYRALSYIINNADCFNIDKNGYSVYGFSAGGHLAAELGTDNLGYKALGLPKPAMLGLAYPFVTYNRILYRFLGFIMAGIRGFFFCKSTDILRHIDKDCPSVYLCSSEDDNMVDIIHSDMLHKKLKDNGINHIYKRCKSCGHGFGAGVNTEAQGWIEESSELWTNATE